MCDRCGEPGLAAHGVSISERPAQRLVGVMWEGSFAEAADGALKQVMARAKALSDAQAGLWKSPLVTLSWSADGQRLRHFAGIDMDGDMPEGFDAVDLPPMRFATSWHGADDGEVIDHYAGMIGWLRENALRHDRAVLDQREEYPPDADLAGPPALRLMLPIA